MILRTVKKRRWLAVVAGLCPIAGDYFRADGLGRAGLVAASNSRGRNAAAGRRRGVGRSRGRVDPASPRGPRIKWPIARRPRRQPGLRRNWARAKPMNIP